MMRMKSLILFLTMMIITVAAFAQEKKDFMRDQGRSYVVVAVMVTILLGIVLYLFRIDRKLKKLEKENK